MPSGISISIASETREYAAGIQRGVIEPTQEAVEALDKLGSSGSGAQLEAGMRDAQRGSSELRSDIDRLRRQVQDAGRTGRSSGSEFKAGMHEADEGVKTLKENTAQNLKEVAASFDGTTQGAVSGVQGLVAEMLEGFGPGGLIAGAVVAGGIGLLLTGIENADTQTEAFKADVSALAQSWIEAGKQGSLSASEIADGIKSLATQTDTSKASLADVEAQAKRLHVPFKDLAQVYAQGGDATKYAIDKTDELIAKERARITVSQTAARSGVGAMGRENAAHDQQIQLLEQQRAKLVGVQRETTEAAKREQEWIKAGGPGLQAKADATASYASGVQGALHEAGASWDEYATKEGGLSLDKYIAVTQKKVHAIEEYQTNLGQLSKAGNQDALNYVESLGTDAAPLLEKFVRAPEGKRAQLLAIWSRLGKAASSSFNSALQDGLPDVYPTPALLPPDDKAYLAAVREANRKARQYLKDHPLQAGAVAYTSYGKPIYQ